MTDEKEEEKDVFEFTDCPRCKEKNCVGYDFEMNVVRCGKCEYIYTETIQAIRHDKVAVERKITELVNNFQKKHDVLVDLEQSGHAAGGSQSFTLNFKLK